MRLYRFALACGLVSIIVGVLVTAVGAADHELALLVIPGVLFIALGAADIAVTVIRNRKASQRQ